MSAKDSIATQTCKLSKEEFNAFLTLYPIPSEYRVILPKSNQTIFDAPPGYVGLYTHSFFLTNLRLPLTEFFCEVLKYFQVHISRLNPFGCAKLTTFVVMYKAYGCEPSVDLFRGFFNWCRAGKWLTFTKMSEKHVPNLLSEVITRIKGWHEWFFYVQDSIIPAKYSQLLSKQNKLDSKSFKGKLPPNIEENPMFQRLGRYPTSVHVFPDPILLLAGLKSSWGHGQQRPVILVGNKEMAFRNFIYTEDDEDLAFLPKEPSPGFGIGYSGFWRSLKPELFVVHPRSVAARIKDRKCKTRGGSLRPPDDARFLTVSDDDEGLPDVLELKDATACHLKIFAITPPAWKNHLDNHIDLELLDLHDRCYARQAVVDNAVNRRSRELLQVIENLRGECDVMRSREKECEGLRVKCEAAMTKFEKNPTVVALREKIYAFYDEEVEELKQDRREVVSKVVPYTVMELVHSDDMGSLVNGYRSSYKKDHTQASNDLATTTFPWLDEFVADPSAPIEALLSKKPPTLQRPAPSRTQVPLPSSQRANPSSVPVSNPMPPPVDASVMKPQSSQLH
ncbi:hypothetical protein Tco_0558483 [Tanacetum coccineum]